MPSTSTSMYGGRSLKAYLAYTIAVANRPTTQSFTLLTRTWHELIDLEGWQAWLAWAETRTKNPDPRCTRQSASISTARSLVLLQNTV